MNIRPSSGVIFVALNFGNIHLLRHLRRESFEMLIFTCWDGKKRGGDADICKCTRIRNTFNSFGKRN